MRDEQGQPLNQAFNAARRLDRDISEMLGVAKGVLADGVVSPAEAALLHDWAQLHPDTVSCWPGSILLARLERVFADGIVTPEEQTDLADLLQQLTGGKAGILAGDTAATELPIDSPPPDLVFPGRTFVFTGKFAFGPRRVCEAAVQALGARARASITRDTNYLVIGTFGRFPSASAGGGPPLGSRRVWGSGTLFCRAR